VRCKYNNLKDHLKEHLKEQGQGAGPPPALSDDQGLTSGPGRPCSLALLRALAP